jgi:dTDP-4-amino-4,6-dideoxygalactose transaminase
MEDPLPLSEPVIGEAEIAEVIAVRRSGWLSTGPPCRTRRRTA